MKTTLLIAFLLAAPASAQWAPGTDVLAARPVCSTVSVGGNIQAAIDACPVGQTVLLGPGTFTVNDYLLINKGITLKGSGPSVTTLRKTNGAMDNSYMAEEYEPLVIIGPSRFQDASPPSTNLTADGVKGSKSVTVASAAGFAVGQYVLLDEDDYTTGAWLPLPPRDGQPHDGKIWASDRLVFPPYTAGYVAGQPIPAELAWFSRSGRPLSEIKEIASISGNTITFTTPLYTTYPVSKVAQLTRFSSVFVKGAGLEDLTLSGGSDGNVVFTAAAHSWVKNIESTKWLGPGVNINASVKVEVRDSHIHHGVWPYPGGGGYGISLAWGASEVLIENNIVDWMNKVIVVRSSGAGSVVGYNFMDNGHIGNYHDWVEVGINGSHMVGGHDVLFEGNLAWNYDSDNTHGNAINMTVFRNHLSGVRSAFSGQTNARAAGLMYGSWWHTFQGNVLGTPGLSTPIWQLGYDPSNWNQAPDPKVLSTVVRQGNFDYVSNAIDVPAVVPASLYLTEKPAFFGSHPWPWVTPESATKLAVLPAKLRATQMVHPCDETPQTITIVALASVLFCAKPADEITRFDLIIDNKTASFTTATPIGAVSASGYQQYSLPFPSTAPGTHTIRIQVANTDDGMEQVSDVSEPLTFTIRTPKPKPSKPKVTGVK